jgi:hypothetical protein
VWKIFSGARQNFGRKKNNTVETDLARMVPA